MAFDDKEAHAREFTDIERTTLRVWLDVENAGDEVLADRVLDAGLQYEHYTSLLVDDPNARTAAQLAKQTQLGTALAAVLQEATLLLSSQGEGKAHRAARFARSITAPPAPSSEDAT